MASDKNREDDKKREEDKTFFVRMTVTAGRNDTDKDKVFTLASLEYPTAKRIDMVVVQDLIARHNSTLYASLVKLGWADVVRRSSDDDITKQVAMFQEAMGE